MAFLEGIVIELVDLSVPDATFGSICISESWKTVSAAYVCVSETWKPLEIKLCVSETWKLPN